MKKLSFAIVAAATVAAASPAIAATTIKNTGTANANAWSVSGNPAAAATVVSDAQVNANFWDANTTTSQWVSTGSSTLAPNGQYTYSTNFTGNVGDTVFFDYWADDTALSMQLDGGASVALSGATWTAPTRGSFTITNANNNVHTLAFTVTNTGSPTNSNPTGFRFQVAAVPEPATWGMMVLGFGAVGFAARRRSKVSGRVVAA